MVDLTADVPGSHPSGQASSARARRSRSSRSCRGSASIISGVVAVLLIVAIAVNKLWPLTFLHVAGGAAWTIIDLFLGFVLGPIMGGMSIPARIEFMTKLMPKMVVIMPTVVADDAGRRAGSSRRRLGTNLTSYPNHGWVVASMIVVGVMAVIALGLLEPANIAVLVELKKRRAEPRGDRAADEALHVLAPASSARCRWRRS